MRTIAIISADAKSAKVPNKSIAPLNGHMLLEYSVRAAQAANVDDVIISTDGDGIAEIGKKMGATVMFRPQSFKKENVAGEDVVAHVIKRIKTDLILFLACAAPFHDVIALQRGVEKIKRGEHDSVFLGHAFPQYIWDVSHTVRSMTFDYENRLPYAETLPYATECGDYLFSRKSFDATQKLLGGRIGFIETHRFSILAIEDMDDLRVAQAMAREFDIQPGRLVRET